MNLQRYISTVYSELIPEKYYKTLDQEIKQVETSMSFNQLRTMYAINNKRYNNNNKTNNVLIHTLFFEIIFGNTLGTLYKKTTNTIFLFPVYFDLDDSSRRMKDILISLYNPLISKKTAQEFNREPGKTKEPKSNPGTTPESLTEKKSQGNMFLFLPVFSDGEDDTKEFTERLTSYFDRAFTYINDIRQKKSNDVNGSAADKFDSIVYTIDKDNAIFTGYYKKKLPEDKIKILNGLVEKFVEKLGCRITSVKDPILKLTRDESRKKMVSESIKDTDTNKENFYKLVDKFNDIYKKTNDKEYLKLASSSENQTKFRIYYRVNNTDMVDSFTEIKPGSSYVYKLTNKDDNKDECKIGYFKERKGSTNQFIFREYKGLSKQICDKNTANKNSIENPAIVTNKDSKDIEDLENEEEEDLTEEAQMNTDSELIIETKNYGSIIKYKVVTKDDFRPYYPGVVSLYTDLHIYEKYKWFQFNEIDGTLSPETNIKMYKNILFDTKSLIDFLKEKKIYTDKSRLAVEFLKINQSNSLLSEYVEYILTHKNSTNVYEETFFSGSLKNFIGRNKKNILEILFKTNELIYMNPQRSSQVKENIKQNYKIVNYTQYPVLYDTDITNHFEKIIYDVEESKYCKKGKCEFTTTMFKDEENKKSIEYTLAIIDVTKDNVEVASDLKSKANCKKLKRSLSKQLRPFLEAVAPRFDESKVGGRSRRRTKNRSKRLRSRRRKYRH